MDIFPSFNILQKADKYRKLKKYISRLGMLCFPNDLEAIINARRPLFILYNDLIHQLNLT